MLDFQNILGNVICFYRLIWPGGPNILHPDLADDSLKEKVCQRILTFRYISMCHVLKKPRFDLPALATSSFLFTAKLFERVVYSC